MKFCDLCETNKCTNTAKQMESSYRENSIAVSSFVKAVVIMNETNLCEGAVSGIDIHRRELSCFAANFVRRDPEILF